MNIKHGFANHRFYIRWLDMMNRCYKKSHVAYKHYGGRGITVSDEFKNAVTYINYIEQLDGYGINGRTTIDRIENDGNYERGNLKWASISEQAINRRVRVDATSGSTGVSFNKGWNKWRAYYKRVHIGLSETKEGAEKLRADYLKTISI